MVLEERLRGVFVQALELEDGVDPGVIRYRNHPRWDSLGHMTLIVAMESEFDVEIGPEQLIEIDCFDAAVKVLRDVGAHG
ncbi:MAG: acyl carrier protein [Catenulispora sp.]|nr:acyl carrier protein [Catenulispora sp.]